MKGQQGGLRGEQGGERGADRDSKWRLSIDLCTKCNFIGGGGKRGAEFLPGVDRTPAPPSGLQNPYWGNVDSCNQKQNSPPDKWYAMQLKLKHFMLTFEYFFTNSVQVWLKVELK